MQALFGAFSLVLLSLGPAAADTDAPAQPTAIDVGERRANRLRTGIRIARQAALAPAAGLLLGAAAAFVGASIGWGGDDTLGLVLFYGSPVAFALGEGFTVHNIGAAVDGPRQGSLAATLGGSAAGTGAGLAIFLSRENRRSPLDRGDWTTFIAGLTVATAATIVSYELSRPRDSKRPAPKVTVMPMLPGGRAPNDAWGLQVGVGF